MASYLYRTAATIYPCCIPALGEFNRSWSYKTCRGKNRRIPLNIKIENRRLDDRPLTTDN